MSRLIELMGATALAACAGDVAPPLRADAGESRHAYVGSPVEVDGSASTGSVEFHWSFGDGRGWDAPRREPSDVVVYERPGRYFAVLTVFDANGDADSDGVVITVTERPVFEPAHSSTIAVVSGQSRVAVVSPDSDEVAVFAWEADRVWLERRFATAARPRTVFPSAPWLIVPCQEAGVVELVPIDGAAPRLTVPLPPGSRPYGAIAVGDDVFVTLQGTGQLAQLRLDRSGGTAEMIALRPAIADARGIASLPDGRLAVSRWRSPEGEGQIAVLDPGDGTVEVWSLGEDPQAPSDTEVGGVPSYLDQLLISPDGGLLVAPSLQVNVGGGVYRSGVPLRHDTMLRAVVSFIDPASGRERFELRKQFDDRGLASAGVLSRHGDFLYVAMRGSRSVERVDLLSGGLASSIPEVGYAPSGVALSGDDRLLFVDAYLSRELVVYDVGDPAALPVELTRRQIPTNEPLSDELLRGKQLFNDSHDRRLAAQGYLACAHCHLDGMSDGRVWDMTHHGEGLRNTISLLGGGGVARRPMHWSANFDEVQDFEHAIRDVFGGIGLMRDEDFFDAGRDHPLGGPKAGLSADLDALAAYVSSLTEAEPSPYRRRDGSLSAAAIRGRALFESSTVGCADCHAGPRLSDSRFLGDGEPLLHDVGTLGPGSGARLGGELPGLATPSLRGVWNSAPYLHDGSAATLREVLIERNVGDRHGVTSSLIDVQVDDLVAYLLSLD